MDVRSRTVTLWSRRRYVWMGVVALSLLLGGCASDIPDPEAGQQQIVVLWHNLAGPEARALETLTDRFNADNPWQIVLVTEYQSDLPSKLREAPESRPDLVTVWPEELQTYVAFDLVGAVPFASPEIAQAWDDFLPMARALYQVDDVPQALPLGLATYLIYYNAEWLADLGYDAGIATWEDFRRVACGATDPARGRIGAGIPARASILMAFLTASGSEVVGDDGYYQFSDENGRAAASLLKTVMTSDCGILYEDWDVGVSRLSKSSMAVIVESSERLSEIKQVILDGRNFGLGIGALPGAEGPGATLWYGPGLMISAPETERQQAALQVMGWFFSAQAQQYFGEATPLVPVRRSVIEEQLEAVDQTLVVPAEARLLALTLAAADDGSWVAWPQSTNKITCRASLLRSLLALQEEDADTDAYIDTAVTACNTGVSSRPFPTPAPLETPEVEP